MRRYPNSRGFPSVDPFIFIPQATFYYSQCSGSNRHTVARYRLAQAQAQVKTPNLKPFRATVSHTWSLIFVVPESVVSYCRRFQKLTTNNMTSSYEKRYTAVSRSKAADDISSKDGTSDIWEKRTNDMLFLWTKRLYFEPFVFF